MCNLYEPTAPESIAKYFGVEVLGGYRQVIGPLQTGPFIVAGRRGLLGQWGMIPLGSKTRTPTIPNSQTPERPNGRPMSTNNARRERIATAHTYRAAWSSGRRCLIPANSFDEPYWGTGKNIWWRFARADGTPWALAGLWSEWTDPETGEVVPSYTIITQNCDDHPLLRLMHKPDPKLPPDQQDKRAVVSIERDNWDQWLSGTVAEAEILITLPALDVFKHGAADPAKAVELPVLNSERP